MSKIYSNCRPDELLNDEYKKLIRHRPIIFYLKFMIWAALICMGFYFLAKPSFMGKFAGITIISMMFAHGIELEHQALHHTATGNRKIDMALGFILGLPLLISISHYRDKHLHHHQHVGTADDSEFFQFSKENNNMPLSFIGNLLMTPHWARVAKLIFAAWTGGEMGKIYNRRNAKMIRLEYAAFGVFLLSMTVAYVIYPINFIFILSIPIAACLHTLIELPEHWNCSASPSVYENTRTVRGGKLIT